MRGSRRGSCGRRQLARFGSSNAPRLDEALGKHRHKPAQEAIFRHVQHDAWMLSASEPGQTQAEDQLLICLKACEPLLELRVDSGGFARL
jgi:hypothetical protein